MSLSAVKPLLALLATATLLTACGGHGSATAPPADLRVEAGEGGVTLTWTGLTGVDYWAYAAQSATICKNCGNSPNSWNSVFGAQSRGWSTPISSPYFFSGTTIDTSLNNDVPYAFIMDGRTNGGPGGEATASMSATPRLAGQNWYTGGAMGTGGITGLAFGPTWIAANNAYATVGTYLGLGAGGIKYKSTDGLNWSAITSATDTTQWKNAAYAFPGTTLQRFVGVGAGGAVVYSTDLATFTSGASGVSQDLHAVASSSNLLVAVGNNGTIVRSTDGNTWAAASSVPSTPNLYAVKYTTLASGGLWVAVGAGGAVLVSTDASTWSAMSSGTTQDLNGVAAVVNSTYPNGVFNRNNTPAISYAVVAVGKNGAVTRSTDGVNWVSQTTLGTGSNLNAIAASSALVPTNQFMVVGDGGQAFTSPDGLTWTARTTRSTQHLIGLIRGLNNQYLTWAADGSTVYSK